MPHLRNHLRTFLDPRQNEPMTHSTPASNGRVSAIVLAAGEGSRMKSNRPKPLHLICGRPMEIGRAHV